MLNLRTAAIIPLLLFSFSKLAAQEQNSKKNSTDYVNPFIGTAPLTDPSVIGYTPPKDWRVWAGLTYPGASVPNAMVQASPITAYHTGAGYQYEDSVIYGFTHTNKGHWNLCNIPILPVSGESETAKMYGSRFDHERETAKPGFYQVFLKDYGIDVKLTTSLHCAFHQYTFQKNQNRQILFALSKANNRIREWHIEQTGKNELQGYQDMGRERVYFFAQVSQDIQDLQITEGRNGHALVLLKDGKTEPVTLKIGLSFVNEANARLNLEEEILSRTFEEVRMEADSQWESLLSKITVKGGTARQKELFYSSLYRVFLWPALRSDVNGEFRDVKGQVVKKDFKYYTIPSLWDTYRNKLVLLSMLSPEVTADVIKTLQDIGEKTGFIPTFFHGDHAAAFIAGSYLRGNHNFDVNAVYQLLLNNAMKEGGTRPHIAEYIEKGYISTPDIKDPHVETKAKAGVAKTLEYAFDDYALSLLAKEVGDTVNYRKLSERSENYKNVFDVSTLFMRGKLENGDWVKNFDPQYPYYEYMYREANAWQVSFFAPHDMDGLIGLYGGKENFESKLDSLFTLPWNPDHIARNVSGFIGQYCHGNQPDHEAPFSYYFVGKPAKSQTIIDQILENLYGIGEDGIALSGMDDAGEMSAWYVFAAAGLYPFTSADAKFLVTVPVFNEVKWQLGDAVPFIQSNPNGGRNIHTIEINGKEQEGYFIPSDLIISGGRVNVTTDTGE